MKCLPGGGMQTVFKKPTLLQGLKSAELRSGPQRLKLEERERETEKETGRDSDASQLLCETSQLSDKLSHNTPD